MPLVEAVPPIRGRVGRPRRRPQCLLADGGYDHDTYRRLLWGKGIKPGIAPRGAPHGFGLDVQRYVVERTIGLLHWFRRLRIRWEIRDDIHEAFSPGFVRGVGLLCRPGITGVGPGRSGFLGCRCTWS
ncbi:hypothetical protein GCM10022214_48650 [Actinomadura miaoliensis]|uniref:Transposase n=1 Tax=Actinomadura miaoliensis TaxID=430685 RepID=A0ABP7W836_9ACTN